MLTPLKAWFADPKRRWLTLVAVVALVWFASWLRGRVPVVEVAEATVGPLALNIAASGRVDGIASDLGFRDSGRVLSTNVDEGAFVREGQILARIEPVAAGLGAAMAGADVLQAPYDGWVVQIYRRAGEVIQAGVPVLRMVKEGDVWVTGYFDSEDALYVEPGDEFVCRAGGYLAQPWNLVVDAVGHAALPREDVPGATRQVRVNFRIVEATFGLPVGTTVDIDGEVPLADRVLTVPAAAVVREEGRTFVWRVETRLARRVEVRTGANNFRRVAIEAGLEPGDEVVVGGKTDLDDGEIVRPEPWREAGA